MKTNSAGSSEESVPALTAGSDQCSCFQSRAWEVTFGHRMGSACQAPVVFSVSLLLGVEGQKLYFTVLCDPVGFPHASPVQSICIP